MALRGRGSIAFAVMGALLQAPGVNVMSSTILVVEDNPDDELLTRRALRKSGVECEIVVARDGQEALDLTLGDFRTSGERLVPALILLDLRMPVVDGREVLRQLRANVRTRCIPVVVLSTSTEWEDIRDSYRLGANCYIRKPVGLDEFVEAIGSLCRFWLRLNLLHDRESHAETTLRSCTPV